MGNIIDMNMEDITKQNFLPYAKTTIVDRAIPYIDGFKPVQRRVMYAMYEGKWFESRGKAAKSARIVGDTMGKYHPHGDSSIYGALVVMTDDYAGMNAPYIKAEGTFGRIWSRDIKAAAMRYTEASLAKISEELFDGIDENAVDMVPNFDESEIEPRLLPTKFPNLLVNSTPGIAVGYSTSLPTYSLKGVCNATIKMLEGKAEKPEDLVEVLGAPDFTTNGHVHVSDKTLLNLIKTGKGSLKMSGSVRIVKDTIYIDEVPYGKKIENIVEDIQAACKDGRIKEISDVIDETGMDYKTGIANLGAKITLKRGYDPRKVLAKLNAYSDLRANVNFQTKVIIINEDGKEELKELGVYELLEKWVDWRFRTVRRQFKFRLDKEQKREHLLSAWEKVTGNLKDVVDILTNNKEETAKLILIQDYKLDNEQVEYLIDQKLRSITQDRVEKELNKLKESRDKIKEYESIISDDKVVANYVANQLREIRDTYGKERMSRLADIIVEEDEKEKIKEVIPDVDVEVAITKNGYIKRLLSATELLKLDNYLADGDSIRYTISCKNTDVLLIFTTSGNCYRLPVHSIESSRTVFKDYIWKLVDKKDEGEILYITNAGDYSGSFNIVYKNGRGRKIWLSDLETKRELKKSCFEAGELNELFVTTEDKFFIITKKRKAAYGDLTIMGMSGSTRKAFKIARIGAGDGIFGIQPISKVPDISKINLEKYKHGYCVKINEDKLW